MLRQPLKELLRRKELPRLVTVQIYKIPLFALGQSTNFLWSRPKNPKPNKLTK